MRTPDPGRSGILEMGPIEAFPITGRRQESHDMPLIISKAALLIQAMGRWVFGGEVHADAARGHEIGHGLTKQQSADTEATVGGGSDCESQQSDFGGVRRSADIDVGNRLPADPTRSRSGRAPQPRTPR